MRNKIVGKAKKTLTRSDGFRCLVLVIVMNIVEAFSQLKTKEES